MREVGGVLLNGFMRNIPAAWGPQVGTEAGATIWTRTGPNEIALTPPVAMALIMLTPQPEREVALGSDRKEMGLAPTGSIELVPPGADLFARWRTSKENMLFALEPDRMSRLAEGEFETDRFDFRPPRIGSVDAKALALARLAREELDRGAEASMLCVDSLLTLFATHMLRTYSSLAERPAPRHVGGLSPSSWRQVNDYIAENLAADLSIAELAGIAGLSPSHFMRAFRETVGTSPRQYVIDRRLALVEHLARTSTLPLAAIAARAGFGSNSHMTATMRRLRGRTPKEIRRARG